MNKKIPYGQSNFADMIKNGYAYIDKTCYIELLEKENNTYQFMLRPRRFGKSLFLSVLENYYDIKNKDNFKILFKDLYISNNRTPEHGSYFILKFNFSGLNTDNHEEFKKSFLDRIQESIKLFINYYSDYFTNVQEEIRIICEKSPGIGALDLVYRISSLSGVKVFILIDEYDHFANNLIALGTSYNNEIRAGGIVRSFYESLKSGTSSVVKRIFITGVSPMMLNDLSSGFNMSTNLSLIPAYNEMFGFTQGEVNYLIKKTGVDPKIINVNLESYYNGYMFNHEGKEKVYNSQMILYLLYRIMQIGKQPKELIDSNLQIDYERLRRLAESEYNRDILLQIIKNNGILSNLHERFSLEQIENDEYFVSLLFYLGLLTDGGTQRGRTWLKIPNYSIKTLYWEFLYSYIKNSSTIPLNISLLEEKINIMAYDGNVTPYLDYFINVFLQRLSNRDLLNFDEKYIKIMLLTTLFMSKLYLPLSEDENINGYSDIYLQKHPAINDIKYEYILEIKYLKKGSSEKEKDIKFDEAVSQINKYREDPRFINRSDLKFIAIVFIGKDFYEAKEL